MRKDLARDLKRIRSRAKEFQSLATDAWIKANSELEAQKLHALGVIIFRWNLTNAKLLGIFADLLNCEPSEYLALAHELNEQELVIRIRALVVNRLKSDTALRDFTEHTLDVLEVCRQNRNQLAHFFPVLGLPGFAGRPLDLPPWDFQRRERNPYAFIKLPFPNSVKDVRRVAKDIGRLNLSLAIISAHLHRTFRRPELTPPPLPKTRTLPRFLWKPPRPSRKERARPAPILRP
jgi:hypothetical protein